MHGSGILEFDTQEGLFRWLAMTYVLELSRGTDSLAIPITVSCQKVDEKEFAARERMNQQAQEASRRTGDLAEARARAAQILAEANRPKPFTAEVRAAALRDLKAGDHLLVRAALVQLAHATRDDRAEEVSAAIVEAMAGMHVGDKIQAMDALAVWGTANAEPALIEAAKSPFTRGKALEQLGRNFKDDAAIDAIVSQFHDDRGAAAAALKKIGPAAEKAVLPLVKESDFWLRGDVIGVLREIGGERSLRA